MSILESLQPRLSKCAEDANVADAILRDIPAALHVHAGFCPLGVCEVMANWLQFSNCTADQAQVIMLSVRPDVGEWTKVDMGWKCVCLGLRVLIAGVKTL